MTKHTEFIVSPITDILKNAVSTTSSIGLGIETFSLHDYVMQSVFLKMTGFQEQKLKCIFWDMATFDYEYRYVSTKKPASEYSDYTDKKSLYREIYGLIQKRDASFNVLDFFDKPAMLLKIKQDIDDIFANTNMSIWGQKSYNEFGTIWNEIGIKHFVTGALVSKSELMADFGSDISLKKIYDKHLYRQRNRTAHNTQSYQQNLPTLKTLMEEDYRYENYFLYFATLILIGDIFVKLYTQFLEVIEDT